MYYQIIHDFIDEYEDICGGKPEKPHYTDKIIAAVKWVDGTVIDAVRGVME